MEKQNITVKVAGNILPLEINRYEEEFYRIAETVFKHKIEYYEKKYASMPRNTIIAMAGYDLLVGFLRNNNSIDCSEALNGLAELL